jgi:hypothetical protein
MSKRISEVDSGEWIVKTFIMSLRGQGLALDRGNLTISEIASSSRQKTAGFLAMTIKNI